MQEYRQSDRTLTGSATVSGERYLIGEPTKSGLEAAKTRGQREVEATSRTHIGALTRDNKNKEMYQNKLHPKSFD